MPDKVMIVAPFWGNNGHPGVSRIERFIRWLSNKGLQILLLKASSEDKAVKTSWGIEIAIRDPLRLYQEAPKRKKLSRSSRKRMSLRGLMAYFFFNPDPLVVWAKRASRHSFVLKHAKGIRWVLSSSPPESSHVVALKISKRLNIDFIADLRDGWLDEPLKPLLQKFWFQRWREGRIERRVLRRARKIFVTSDEWKKLLNQRLPFTKQKAVVLTNGYTDKNLLQMKATAGLTSSDGLVLLHSGRFTSSSSHRKVDCLLEPLFYGLMGIEVSLKIKFLGNLNHEDIAQIDHWRHPYKRRDSSLEVCEPVTRNEMWRNLYESDGLLLLSMSYAAIPSKLFEYLCTGKPILSITFKKSAVWNMCESIPQVFLIDYNNFRRNKLVYEEYFRACLLGYDQIKIPEKYSEAYLSKIFLKEIAHL